MKIDYIERKDLLREIKTFIDSPQHLVAEGGYKEEKATDIHRSRNIGITTSNGTIKERTEKQDQ